MRWLIALVLLAFAAPADADVAQRPANRGSRLRRTWAANVKRHGWIMARAPRPTRSAVRSILERDASARGRSQAEALMMVGRSLEAMRAKIPVDPSAKRSATRRVSLPESLRNGMARLVAQEMRQGAAPDKDGASSFQIKLEAPNDLVTVTGPVMSDNKDFQFRRSGKLTLRVEPRQANSMFLLRPETAWVIDAENFGPQNDLSWTDHFANGADIRRAVETAELRPNDYGAAGPRYEIHFDERGSVIGANKIR